MTKCIGCNNELPLFPPTLCPECETPTKESFEAKANQFSTVEELDPSDVKKGSFFVYISLVGSIAAWTIAFLFYLANGKAQMIAPIAGCFINFSLIAGIYFGQPSAKYHLGAYNFICILLCFSNAYLSWSDPSNAWVHVTLFSVASFFYIFLLVASLHPSVTVYAKSRAKRHLQKR